MSEASSRALIREFFGSNEFEILGSEGRFCVINMGLEGVVIDFMPLDLSYSELVTTLSCFLRLN